MKRLIPLLLVLALMVSLAGCGSSASSAASAASAAAEVETTAPVLDGNTPVAPVTPTPAPPAPEGSAVEPADDAAAPAATTDTPSDDNLTVTATYLYQGEYGTNLYFVVLKNNASAPVNITGDASAKDAAGKELATANCSVDTVGPGQEALCCFSFRDIEGIADVSYVLNYEEDTLYSPIINDLTVETTENLYNVVVAVTNNTAVNALYVDAYALFFDADNNVIGFDDCYPTDDDLEIKVGATVYGQMNCAAGAYDHAAVFFTGCSDGSSTEAPAEATDGFDVNYGLWDNGYSTICFVVVKNNTDRTVSVSGNAVAKNAGGRSVGAGNMEISVLGPGEESIEYFYFSDVLEVDHIEPILTFSDDPVFDPVLGNLAFEITDLEEGGFAITATNYGDVAAKSLEAYVLFYDEGGNICDYTTVFLTDDDYELKAGETLTEDVVVSTEYYSYAVVYSGYAEKE